MSARAKVAVSDETRLRRRLARELARDDDDEINLARVALIIAAEEYPNLDITGTIRQLDDMALEIADRVAEESDPHAIIGILNWYLFEVQGFEGNESDYFDPRNNYLNEVLARHTGIPLTLSIAYMEVAARVGFQVEGVGFPGHFLVKHETEDGDILIDPFNKGELLDEDDCRKRLESMFGGNVEYTPRMLESATRRSMVARLLLNLKEIYLKANDFPRALAQVARLLLVTPDDAEEVRDRGMISYRLECYSAAVADLSRYLEMQPQAGDAKEIRETLRVLWQLESRLN
ncbi:MAG: tetratricopeptide repeat protein [Deltaproteobacteria bacterium]|nr:tetratricopeptide repeat protein [Deltaproteobacteria bacterium]